MSVLTERPILSLADLEAFDPAARQTGHETRFLCPLPACEGKRADTRHRSLSVNLDSGAWTCQRCKASGKISDKWEPRERLSPRARARRAFGLTPHPVRQAAVPPTTAATNAGGKVPTWRRGWDQAPSVADTPGADYLRLRGIPVDVAIAADVRYIERWKHWTKNQAGEWHCEATSRRVAFPVQDQIGELVGIQGRAIDQEHAGEKVITRGTAGVFATWGSVADLASVSRRVLVEAPIDALSLASAGVHALSTQGTAYPDWLPRALALKPTAIAFDNDEPDRLGKRAGDEAAAKLIPQLRSYGADVERWRPPGAKDWNDLLQARGVAWLRLELEAGPWDAALVDSWLSITLQRIGTLLSVPVLEADGPEWAAAEAEIEAACQARQRIRLRLALDAYEQLAHDIAESYQRERDRLDVAF